MYRPSFYEKLFDVLIYVILLILVIVTLYPFVYVLTASLSDPRYVVHHQGVLLWPHGLTLQAYLLVFKDPNILTGYRNTLFYVTVGTVLNVVMTSFGAYALSRRYLRGTGIVMVLIVFTMIFTGGLIPTYLNVRNLGMVNSPLALIIPSALNTFNLIVMRTAYKAVPDSLEESAKMDGANDFSILFRIFIPVTLPVFAVITLFYLVQNWNSWFPALIYLRDRELYPVQLILREILIASSTDSLTAGSISQIDQAPIGETIKYATIMVVTLPIVCIYPFLQKYFTKGILVGSVKE